MTEGRALLRRRTAPPRPPCAAGDRRRPDRRPGRARGRDDARRVHLGGGGAQALAGAARGGRRRTPRRAPRARSRSASEPLVSWPSATVLRLPVMRGVVALGESLSIGFKALGISANAQIPPDEEGEQKEIGGGAWAGTVAFALLFAVGLFFLLPAGLTNLFRTTSRTASTFVLIEKLDPDLDLPPLPLADLAHARPRSACSSTTAPSTRRSPATRRRAADAGERAALLAPAPALRDELPAAS